MSNDLHERVEQMYTFFQQTYRLDGVNVGPGRLFLAFEELAAVVSPEHFKLNPGDTDFNAAVIQQHGSHLVDFVADLDEQGSIRARADLSPTVEGQYQQLLNAARPSASDDAEQATFLKLQGQAQRLLDEQKSTMNLVDFLPVQFTPQFWFNPADTSNWSTYSTKSSPPPNQPPAPPVKIAPWRWRMVTPEVRAPWSELQLAARAHAPTPARPIKHLTTREARLAEPARAGALRGWKGRGAVDSAAVSVARQLPQATPSSDGFSLFFEYCLVDVARPWLSSTFLRQPGWHVPGATAGSWALGKYAAVTQPFGYLPAKMLVVKNVSVTAQWSEEDLSRIRATPAALGPLSLLRFEFTNGELRWPDMQILGWLCQVMPVLPPTSDPALASDGRSVSGP
jgi:hypothetical protein